MKPEYFPPREDVILQNEAPTDLYILVTGSVVRSSFLFFLMRIASDFILKLEFLFSRNTSIQM